MRIAFYAPLKPLDHPNPSGDRRMGRLLRSALDLAGHDVRVASRLRTRDAKGSVHRQLRLRDLSEAMAERYLKLCHRDGWFPEAWFTYHLYYKAPDWLGPVVARQLEIPYMVAEASHAPKRAGGAWDLNHRGVEAALAQASHIIALNRRDMPCLERAIETPERVVYLPPFLENGFMQETKAAAEGPVDLITVAMMRPGDKMASYQLLASALKQLSDLPWRLTIVGDGKARADVEAVLPPSERVRYMGLQPADRLPQLYGASQLFVWPAIREAYGMVILEAQAAGLPVIAGDAGGVPDIVSHQKTGLLSAEGDLAGFTINLRHLILSPELRQSMGAAGQDKVSDLHLIAQAADRLKGWLDQAQGRPAW